METASKLQECGEKDPTVPFGTSRDTLCGSLSKVETGLQHSLKVHCTPTEAELGSGSCGWWGWLECFGAVTLAAAACAVATAGAGIIPCAKKIQTVLKPSEFPYWSRLRREECYILARF